MSEEASSTGFGTGEFSQPVVLGPDDPPPPPPPPKGKAAEAKATAATCAELFDLGLALGTGYPLSQDERRDFVRDLAAVLKKYDVPSLPYAEEIALAGTTIRIIIPRVIHKRSIPEPEEMEPIDDSVGARQEGQWQNSAAEKIGVPPPTLGTEAASALA